MKDAKGKGRDTEIFDRGRRGEPMLGCDCVQCFGYCMVDYAVARRELPENTLLLLEKRNED